ncbi:MAG: LPS assembly protein LptD [Desulfobulbaceae bacterium]|nr:LPS assembly protein LptD [Desulfobulbaceae bacterium]
MKQKKGLSPIHPLSAILLFLIAGLSFCPLQVLADEIQAPQWNITADKMTRYENPPSIIAEGNVLLEKTQEIAKKEKRDSRWDELLEEQAATEEATEEETITQTRTLTTIKADWIVYDINLGSIRARGNLLVKIGTDQLMAEKGEVDLNRETGTFTDASIIRKEKDLHLEGKIIEKTGDLTYHIEDGWVITCKLKDEETPPWSFASKEADITDGGYAILKHATFRIKNVPILYTPWMMIPVKRTRQTGFLFPEISFSGRDGFGINLPFFLNLSPSSDLTVYPQYMANRGLMAGLELRYILNQESKGGLMINYLNDDLSDPSEVDYYREGNFTHTNQDRYWIRGKADQDIAGWTTRLDVDVVSDRDYLTEFTSGLTGFTESNNRFSDVFGRGFESKTIDERKNSLRVLKAWTNMSLQGDLIAINDVRFNKSNPTPLWQLPDINFTGLLPIGETLINLDWDVNYINYWRENGVGAHRIDIFPRLSSPLPLGEYLEATAELGLRDTSYLIQEYGDADWQGSNSENRFLVDFQTEVGTTLVRDFNTSLGDVYAWSHTFRPFVNYHYIPDVDQDDLPQFDQVDMIDDSNLITYGIDNWFKIFGSRNNAEYERDYGYIKINQGYDLRSEVSDTPLTPVNIKIGYWPLNDFWLVYRTDIDVYGEGVTNYSFEGSYRNSRGDAVSADYRYDEFSNTNSVSANAKVHLIYNLLATYYVERSIEYSTTIEENIALIYKPSCWSVELSSNYTPGNQKIMLVFRLANIGNPLGVDLPGF